ncbi:MAG: hypothetical protein M1504_00345 [Candidatus Marsarchaeota archaeon]|nr:hypothetical protein [Candidatus Marsarchaeota archaeon]
MRNVSSFFDTRSDFYENYLNHTDQKKVASNYIAMALDRLPEKHDIDVLCLGGGSGDGDIRVLANMPLRIREKLNISYIDPSAAMYQKFAENLKTANLDKNLDMIHIKKFESSSCRPKKADIILALNSFYFIKGWKRSRNGNNPLNKMFGLLNDNGIAIIVLRSEKSPHTMLKKLAGGGKTTSTQLKESLKACGLPYYSEEVTSHIDITDCFDKDLEFVDSAKSYKLLSFIFGDRWKSISGTKKTAIIQEMKKYARKEAGSLYIESIHEYVWIRKEPEVQLANGHTFDSPQKRALGKKIRANIKTFVDFPVDGIAFRDTTPLMRDAKLFHDIINYVRETYKGKIDVCVAKDMQALIWAGAIANSIGCGVVPMFRKDLAGPIITSIYEHEYNPNRIVNLRFNSISPGCRVLLVDYIMATGETMRTMARMVEHLGGKIVGIFSVAELCYLNPRKGLQRYDVNVIVKYSK